MIASLLTLALTFSYPTGYAGTRAAAITFDFSRIAPGCYTPASLGYTLQNAGGPTECWNGTTLLSCTTSQVCISTASDGTVGLVAENTRVNNILNSATHPKSGELSVAISASNANSDCFIWARGSGTITATVSVGSVAADPNGCIGRAISAGTPIRGEACRFTAGASGMRLAITTTAGVTAAQFECRPSSGQGNPLGPTGFILNAGTATPRTISTRINRAMATSPLSYCVKGVVAPTGLLGGAIFSASTVGTLGFAPTSVLRRSSDVGTVDWTGTWPTVTANSVHIVTASTVDGVLAAGVTVDGLPMSLTPPASPVVITSYPTRLIVPGVASTGTVALDGVISKLFIFPGRCQ